LSSVVFPPPAFDEEEEKSQSKTLQATDYAQAAIGVFSAGLFNIMTQAGFTPDFTAGHSFGELTALWAGGVLSEDDFLRLVKARGKAMSPPPDPSFDAGGMLAVKGALSDIEREVENLDDVVIANLNSNSQVVLAGPTSSIKHAHEVLGEKDYKVTLLPVSAAFHTPLVGHASAPFAEAVAEAEFKPARIPVYSNTTGDPYPESSEDAKALLANHILNPVYYKRQIENIYAAGGRIFVECGPRRITSNLVEDILEGKPHTTIALNSSRTKSSDRQFREAVVKLLVAGVALSDVDPYSL
jgi:acyl transferase domain-containing protein